MPPSRFPCNSSRRYPKAFGIHDAQKCYLGGFSNVRDVAADSGVVCGSPSYSKYRCVVLNEHLASLIDHVENSASMRCYGIYTLGSKVPFDGWLPNHLELIHRGRAAECKPVPFPHQRLGLLWSSVLFNFIGPSPTQRPGSRYYDHPSSCW
jgi:hypothetical protein